VSERRYLWVERLTAGVLLLVVLALVWMIVAAYRPEWGEAVALRVQVWVAVGLLTGAVFLVSLVALLHTRA
jgi:ABC-type polysaccharide transport system permease subunit